MNTLVLIVYNLLCLPTNSNYPGDTMVNKRHWIYSQSIYDLMRKQALRCQLQCGKIVYVRKDTKAIFPLAKELCDSSYLKPHQVLLF